MDLFKVINIITIISLLSLASSLILFIKNVKNLGESSKNIIPEEIGKERSEKIDGVVKFGLVTSIFAVTTLIFGPLSVVILISNMMNWSLTTTYITMGIVESFFLTIIILNLLAKKKNQPR